jgi:hypothetical protein
MKFLSVAVLCILVSCTDSKPEKSEEHSEEDKIQISPIIQQQSTVEEDEEPPFKPIFSKQYAKVFSCHIGLYQQQCLMVLYFNRNGNHYDADVIGEYFYVKHQKRLDLEGDYENERSRVYLTESYKGEQSGVMFFCIAAPNEDDFWAVNEESNHEKLTAKLLFDFDPTKEEVVIKHERYESRHQVHSDTDEEQYATDELKISWINDQYLGFYYHVVNFSQNLGTVSGIAKVQDDGSAIWEDENGFQLTFTFSKNQAHVKSSNYEEMTYGGFGVTFGGNYTKI